MTKTTISPEQFAGILAKAKTTEELNKILTADHHINDAKLEKNKHELILDLIGECEEANMAGQKPNLSSIISHHIPSYSKPSILEVTKNMFLSKER